jgi:hypothetical protein
VKLAARPVALTVVVLASTGYAGCVRLPDDYTPQIHVAPGAAVRARWIQSKNAAEEVDAAAPEVEADVENEGPGPSGPVSESDSGPRTDVTVDASIDADTDAGVGGNANE